MYWDNLLYLKNSEKCGKVALLPKKCLTADTGPRRFGAYWVSSHFHSIILEVTLG